MSPQYWEPGVQYDFGAVVAFEGAEYKIIQPHRSQGDWTPPLTPALWGRVEGCYDSCNQQYGGDCKDQGCGQQQQQTQFQAADQQYQPTGAQPPQEHKEKHWYDIDDKRKKELEIGGGIAAGITAVGAGFMAYKSHENKKEQRQAQAWSAENWFEESQVRTQQWRSGRYNAPFAWIWNVGTTIPRDAIQGGEERGETLYICRAYYQGGIMVGKASRVFKKGAVIGFKKEEIHVDKYEILVGDSRAVKWETCSGQFNPARFGNPSRLIEGGREPDGTPIYIAQAPHHGAVHPGKACEVYGDGCFIPYDNSEKKVKEYAVLCRIQPVM